MFMDLCFMLIGGVCCYAPDDGNDGPRFNVRRCNLPTTFFCTKTRSFEQQVQVAEINKTNDNLTCFIVDPNEIYCYHCLFLFLHNNQSFFVIKFREILLFFNYFHKFSQIFIDRISSSFICHK